MDDGPSFFFFFFFRAQSFTREIPSEVWEDKSVKASSNDLSKTVITALSVATPWSRHKSVALPLTKLGQTLGMIKEMVTKHKKHQDKSVRTILTGSSSCLGEGSQAGKS